MFSDERICLTQLWNSKTIFIIYLKCTKSSINILLRSIYGWVMKSFWAPKCHEQAAAFWYLSLLKKAQKCRRVFYILLTKYFRPSKNRSGGVGLKTVILESFVSLIWYLVNLSHNRKVLSIYLKHKTCKVTAFVDRKAICYLSVYISEGTSKSQTPLLFRASYSQILTNLQAIFPRT